MLPQLLCIKLFMKDKIDVPPVSNDLCHVYLLSPGRYPG